jgi:hypothetical protein
MSGAWSNRQGAPRDSLRHVGFAIAWCYFLVMFAFGPSIVIPTSESDAATVLDLAREAQFVDAGNSPAYHATALLVSYISPTMQHLIVFLLGTAVIYRVFRDLGGWRSVGLGVFLTIAPSTLVLPLFVKDTVISLLALGCLAVMSSSRLKPLTQVLVVGALYVAYAALFRRYYFLIGGLFVVACIMVWARPRQRFLIGTAVILALVLTPSDIFTSLEGARDILNQYRLGRDLAGARTAFANILPPIDLFSFVVNYVYAFLRLNLPIFFASFGFKELFLWANCIVYFALLWIGARSRRSEIVLPVVLFTAHLAVSWLFEPDLGSYLRHSSSVLLYLVPALALLNRAPATRRAIGRFTHSGLPYVRYAAAPRRAVADSRQSLPTSSSLLDGWNASNPEPGMNVISPNFGPSGSS